MNKAIILNTLKEKLSKKHILIVTILFAVLLFFFSAENSSISIGGKQLTDIDMLLPYFLLTGTFICALTAIFASANSIPIEYERKNSYLIWPRGISQSNYHISVSLGSAAFSAIITIVFYLTYITFILLKGGDMSLLGTVPISFLLTLSLIFPLSFITSALSVKLGFVTSSVIISALFVCGMFKGIFVMLLSAMQGTTSEVLKHALKVIPNFYDISAQASNFAQSMKFDLHILLGALLLMYFGLILLYVLKRKEA